ncbi:MAG: hypothetical protein K1X88_19485 [Nannocystaceae bacterium]|nr:hypothetical protein [Nannocystaceae bacterium]
MASTRARSLCLGLALTLGAVAPASAAAAAPCPIDPEIAPHAPALAQQRAEARLAFIRGRMDAAAKPSRQWALGWGVGLGLIAVAQAAAAPFVHPEEAPDFWMGALQAAIGAGERAIFIPHVLIERRRQRKRGAKGDLCAQLAAAEHAFVHSAKWERRGKALWQHALSIAVNAAVGVALGVGFGRQVQGARVGTVGATVGEVMIITQPTPVMKSLERYRSGAFATTPTASWGVRPMVLWRGAGLAFGGRL